MFLEAHPELDRLYHRFLYSPDLLNLRPELAAARTMASHFTQIANLNRAEGLFAMSEPSIVKAIAALKDVARIAKEVVALEQAAGPVSRTELDRIRAIMVEAFQRFVPGERYLEAVGFLRERLTGEPAAPTENYRATDRRIVR